MPTVVQTGSKVFHLYFDNKEDEEDIVPNHIPIYQCTHCGREAENEEDIIHTRNCKIGMITGKADKKPKATHVYMCGISKMDETCKSCKKFYSCTNVIII